MKILMFPESYHPYMCGVTEAVDNLVKSLRQLGHWVYIITPAYPDYIDSDSFVIRLPSYTLPAARGCYFAKFWNIREVVGRLIALRPDIIHTHGPYATHWIALKVAKILQVPVIMTWHTLIEDYLKTWLGKLYFLFQPLVKYPIRSLTNRCSLILAPTNYVAKMLQDYMIKTTIQVLPLAIDLKMPEFSPKQIKTLREKYHPENESRVLVYVGRVVPEKNISVLLETFSLILLNCPQAHLILIGDGKLPFYQKAAQKQGIPSHSITFLGPVARQEVFQILAIADLLIHPSTTDNSPRTILEAMACQLPVVAVRAGGVPDLVEDTETGLLVNPGSDLAVDLARVCGELLAQPEKRVAMGLAGKAVVFSEKYDPSCYAEKMEEIYLELIKRSKR